MGDCQDLRTYLIAQHGGVQIGDNLSGQNGYLKCSASATRAFADSPAWMLITSAAEENGQSTAPLTLALSSACSPMYRVFKALSESNVTTAQAYAGDVGIARVTQAFSSLIGTAVTAVPVLITGIITMAWIALTFALYITGPFKLAFATYTGKAKMAKEWAGDLVHAWASRLAYGIVLSLTILIIAWMLASTISFGLRLVWLGVILFFFWKLVQKVQELIRPGAASIAPNLAGDVQRRTAGGAKTVTRTATRSTVGAGAGVIAAGQRRRMMAADPTRGPIRRTAGTLLTPVSLLTGGLRGAAFGPQDAHRRSCKTMSKAQVNAVKAANAANAAGKSTKKDPRQGRHYRNNGQPIRSHCPHRGHPESQHQAGGQLTRHRPGRRRCRPGPAAAPPADAGSQNRATPAAHPTGQPPPARNLRHGLDPTSCPAAANGSDPPRPAPSGSGAEHRLVARCFGRHQSPTGTDGDDEPVRRPLEPTPAGRHERTTPDETILHQAFSPSAAPGAAAGNDPRCSSARSC